MTVTDPMVGSWAKPPEEEIHIWWRRITDQCPLESDFLNAEECERAARFKIEAPRRQFVCARHLLRWLVGRYLDRDPREIEFQISAHGKPSLEKSAGLHFNISHTDGMVVLVFASKPVGIDVERIDRKVEHDALSKRFFARAEQDKLTALPESERRHAFFRCWTQKEAYLKALGSGLSRDTRSFAVNCLAGSPGLLKDDLDATAGDRWKLMSIDTEAGYCVSVAMSVEVESLRVFRL